MDTSVRKKIRFSIGNELNNRPRKINEYKSFSQYIYSNELTLGS